MSRWREFPGIDTGDQTVRGVRHALRNLLRFHLRRRRTDRVGAHRQLEDIGGMPLRWD